MLTLASILIVIAVVAALALWAHRKGILTLGSRAGARSNTGADKL